MNRIPRSFLDSLDAEMKVYSEYMISSGVDEDKVSSGWELNILADPGIHQTQSRSPRRLTDI